MVRQNPTMAAAWLAAIVLAAGAAQAQPFQMVSDGADGVWVIDEGSGAVELVPAGDGAGAKLIDVFGADAQVREAPARPARPACETVRGPSATGRRAARPAGAVRGPGTLRLGRVMLPWRDRMFRRRDRGDVGRGATWGPALAGALLVAAKARSGGRGAAAPARGSREKRKVPGGGSRPPRARLPPDVLVEGETDRGDRRGAEGRRGGRRLGGAT